MRPVRSLKCSPFPEQVHSVLIKELWSTLSLLFLGGSCWMCRYWAGAVVVSFSWGFVAVVCRGLRVWFGGSWTRSIGRSRLTSPSIIAQFISGSFLLILESADGRAWIQAAHAGDWRGLSRGSLLGASSSNVWTLHYR